MRRWFRNWPAMLIVAMVVGVSWLIFRAPAEPVYQGKPLHVWLQNYRGGWGPKKQETDEALRQMGTNCIPALLSMLRAYDSPLKAKLFAWAEKHHVPGIHHTHPSVANEQGFLGFEALGPAAAGAVPELIKILERNISPSSQNFTARSLAMIGPEAKAAVPGLLRVATSPNRSDHSDAIWALGEIHADADEVVPVLLRALRNPSPDPAYAVIALGKFGGDDAKSAIPALLEILTNLKSPSIPRGIQAELSQSTLRREVVKALKQIDPEAYGHGVFPASQGPGGGSDFFTLPKGGSER